MRQLTPLHPDPPFPTNPTPRHRLGTPGITRLRRLRVDDMTPLQQLKLFSGIDRRHLRALAASSEIVGVPAGSVIANAGHRAAELVGVLNGRVDAVDVAGRTLRLTDGDHIDGAAVFDRAHRTWTLTARTPATLLVVHPRAIDLAVLDIPGFEWRLRTADERREGWSERPLPSLTSSLRPAMAERELQLR